MPRSWIMASRQTRRMHRRQGTVAMLRDSRLVGRKRLLDNATESILLRTVAALLPKVVVPTRGTH